jgi:hypothetical protein
MTNLKIRMSRQLRVFVPGADALTVITAVEPIANEWAKRLVDVASVLNGQIGDTTSGIQLIGPNKGLGRAGRQAGRTAATVVAGLW